MAGQPRIALAARTSSAAPRDPPSVRLETPLALLAQAVGTALRSHGVNVEIGSGRRSDGGRDASQVLVVLDDLVTVAAVRRVLALVGSANGPVLVLTGRDRGHYWGALVAAGATSIMSSAASLDEVVSALEVIHAGEELQTRDERDELLAQWDLFVRQQREAITRLASLTARERAVLEGMTDGIAVPDQAELLEVAQTTIRSHVKAILRKLGVRSQIAAVALVKHAQSPLTAGVALTADLDGQLRRSPTTSLGP